MALSEGRVCYSDAKIPCPFKPFDWFRMNAVRKRNVFKDPPTTPDGMAISQQVDFFLFSIIIAIKNGRVKRIA